MTTAQAVGEQAAAGLGKDELTELYRHMVCARRIDQYAQGLLQQGAISFHVPSLGEEAAIVGAAYARRPADWVLPCYREFGAAVLRGMPVRRYFDNLFGNADALAKGKQMPNHWSCKEAKIASASAPNGTQITAAVGLAWAARMRGDDVATLVYFGDEATSSGDFHNGMNFAGVYRVPSVLLCRNDGSSTETASSTMAAKGVAYGVEAVRCDGNDVLEVVATVKDALERAANGAGPTLIDAVTQRMQAPDDIDRDPTARLRQRLVDEHGWDDARDHALVGGIDAEVEMAVTAAQAAEPPNPSSLFDDVFRELPWHLRDQRDELLG